MSGFQGRNPAEAQACKVLVVDMPGLLGRAIQQMLDSFHGTEVATVTGQPQDILQRIKEQQPDVVILEIGERKGWSVNPFEVFESQPNSLVMVFDMREECVQLYFGARASIRNLEVVREAIALRRRFWSQKLVRWAREEHGAQPTQDLPRGHLSGKVSRSHPVVKA